VLRQLWPCGATLAAAWECKRWETNGTDDDASVAEGIPDERPPTARRDASPAAVNADQLPPPPERRPALRAVSRRRARIGRPSRLTPALAAELAEAVYAVAIADQQLPVLSEVAQSTFSSDLPQNCPPVGFQPSSWRAMVSDQRIKPMGID
jgi:hypothetical protein